MVAKALSPDNFQLPVRSLIEATERLGGAVIIYDRDDHVAWVNHAQQDMIPFSDFGPDETYETLFWKIFRSGLIGNKKSLENPSEWLKSAVATRKSSPNLCFINTYPWGRMMVSQLCLDDGVSVQARVKLSDDGFEKYFGACGPIHGIAIVEDTQRTLSNLQCAINGLDIAIGLVGNNLSFIHYNFSMRDLIETGDGLTVTQDGIIKACDQYDDIVLQQTLRSSLMKNGVDTPYIVPLRRPCGKTPHILSVSPGESSGTAILVISRFGENIDAVSEALKQGFNLHQAEADVAARLGAGMSVKEIANDRGVTERTAYNQVQSLKKSLRRSQFSAGGLPDITNLVMKVAAITRTNRWRH